MSEISPPYTNSSLPLESRVQDLVNRLSLAEKVSLMAQYQAAIPRLGIKPYKHGTEAAHGISWLGKATSFPQVSGLASTWDRDLLEEVGSVISTEARAFFRRDPARNGLTLWTPTVDLGRDPRWGRNEECWGEDPYLAGNSAGALIRGLQGSDPRWLKSCATLKHFIANNSELNRGTASISLDPRNLREYYLRSFEICIREAKAQSMMTSYNAVNGIPANLNPDLDEIIRQEWGFGGFVVSDAGDVTGTKREHGWVKTWSEAVAQSIKAGIDSITDETPWVIQAIQDALARHELSEADLDRAVGNSLRVRFKLGEFDPDCIWNEIGADSVDLPEHRALSLKAAEASFVLLENREVSGQSLLPIDPKIHQHDNAVAVLGPLGDMVVRDWYSGSLPYSISPLKGLANRFGARSVQYASGNPRLGFMNPLNKKMVGIDGKDCILEVFDWGQSNHTFKRVDTGKWLSTDDQTLHCNADEVFGWFTKEVFSVEGSFVKGEVKLTTWNGTPILINDHGELTLAPVAPESQGPIGIAALKKAELRGNTSAPLLALPDGNGLEEALALAKVAHTAIVCIGNHPLVNAKETIDRPHLDLAKSQEDLVKAVMGVNPRTVVVIFGSYPLASSWIAKHVPAILHAAHPGQETGTALATILAGDRNPSGRLPVTWYKNVADLPDLLDYDIIGGGRTYQYFHDTVLWPFGHGKSYTTFDWSDLSVEDGEAPGTKRVSVTIKNSGARAGAEVVQCYVRAQASLFKRPLRQLAAFGRVELAPGESRRVDLTIERRSFELWHPFLERWYLESIDWEIGVSSSAIDQKLATTISISGEQVIPRDLGKSTKAKSFDYARAMVLGYNDESPSCGFVRLRQTEEYANIENKSDKAILLYRQAGPASTFVSVKARVKGQGTLKFFAGTPDESTLLTSIVVEGYLDLCPWRTVSNGFVSSPVKDLTITLEGSLNLAWFQFQ